MGSDSTEGRRSGRKEYRYGRRRCRRGEPNHKPTAGLGHRSGCIETSRSTPPHRSGEDRLWIALGEPSAESVNDGEADHE
jgi:hypothetical protein